MKAQFENAKSEMLKYQLYLSPSFCFYKICFRIFHLAMKKKEAKWNKSAESTENVRTMFAMTMFQLE